MTGNESSKLPFPQSCEESFSSYATSAAFPIPNPQYLGQILRFLKQSFSFRHLVNQNGMASEIGSNFCVVGVFCCQKLGVTDADN